MALAKFWELLPYATWVPTGQCIAFVESNDFSASAIHLTTMGSAMAFNSVPDWIDKEEMDCGHTGASSSPVTA
ncbi:hypothetical protein EV421DRAFT_1910030 [Armillaria borealis]|uniref:Dipeptidylpeptidase IV N-terminal domain-containing protein n=1 Tax=Armillaria borealis TaxID=47425 RepID=A0AA39J1H6_9AGAR|nr:hypothetical protein EV421DRAFT_1910030 [Armillaria borealis]